MFYFECWVTTVTTISEAYFTDKKNYKVLRILNQRLLKPSTHCVILDHPRPKMANVKEGRENVCQSVAALCENQT